MATAVEIRDAVDDKILERIQNDGIERYSLSDGRQIQKATLDSLMSVRANYASLAAEEENGTSILRFGYFDDGTR